MAFDISKVVAEHTESRDQRTYARSRDDVELDAMTPEDLEYPKVRSAPHAATTQREPEHASHHLTGLLCHPA
ncbi:MAG: hypothetical protein M0Z66_09965 [Thermaerobacter sp.]|nr:hypothetical protein [Thermaerobacter sp.]